MSQVKLLEQHPALRKTKRTFKMGSSVSRSCWRAGEHGFCMSVRQYYLDRRRVRPGAAPIALCVLPSCCAHRLEPPAAERADRALCTLVCAGTLTRRALRCKVSRSTRTCPATQLMCSRTHRSYALAHSRHPIGARSTLNPPPPRPPPSRTAPEAATVAPLRAAEREAVGTRMSQVGARGCGVSVRAVWVGTQGRVAVAVHRGGRSSCGRPLGREQLHRRRPR